MYRFDAILKRSDLITETANDPGKWFGFSFHIDKIFKSTRFLISVFVTTLALPFPNAIGNKFILNPVDHSGKVLQDMPKSNKKGDILLNEIGDPTFIENRCAPSSHSIFVS
jgi:hypothetical protein